MPPASAAARCRRTCSNGFILPNAVTLTNSNVTFGGNGNRLTFTGLVTLSGTAVTLNVAANETTIFTGVISGGATAATNLFLLNLNTTGTGTFVLNAVNTFFAQVNLGGGAVNTQNTTALGNAGNAAVLNTGATLQIANVVGQTKPLVMNGGTLAWAGAGTGAPTETGTILLQQNATVNVSAGSLILSGAISGPGRLTKTGGGSWHPAGSTYPSAPRPVPASRLSTP